MTYALKAGEVDDVQESRLVLFVQHKPEPIIYTHSRLDENLIAEFISFHTLEKYHKWGYRAYDLINSHGYNAIVYINEAST